MVNVRFNNIIAKHAGYVSCRSGMEFEDAEQELRIVMWHAEGTYEPAKGTRAAYLSTILHNKARKLITFWTVQYTRDTSTVRNLGITDGIEEFEDSLVNRIYLDELEGCLNEPLRCIFKNLRLGYTQSETARMLGITQPRVSQMMEDIRHYACQFEV